MISKFSTMPDKELVILLKDGSQQAVGELYARYKEGLLYYCKKYLNNHAGAEDVVQDIFLQIWETRDSLNAELSFSGYIYTLAHHRILNMFRQFDVHSRFAKHILASENDTTNETEDLIMENDYVTLLNDLIEKLPPMQKEVFRLSNIEGLTYKEISELLQISHENVRKHASLATKKIKNQFLQHKDALFYTITIILMFFL